MRLLNCLLDCAAASKLKIEIHEAAKRKFERPTRPTTTCFAYREKTLIVQHEMEDSNENARRKAMKIDHENFTMFFRERACCSRPSVRT